MTCGSPSDWLRSRLTLGLVSLGGVGKMLFRREVIVGRDSCWSCNEVVGRRRGFGLITGASAEKINEFLTHV